MPSASSNDQDHGVSFAKAPPVSDSGINLAVRILTGPLGPRAVTRMNTRTPNPDELPDDVAPVATFLLSDRSEHLNGQCIRAAGLDVAWTLPTRYAGMVSRPSRSIDDVEKTLESAQPGPQPFGLSAVQPR